MPLFFAGFGLYKKKAALARLGTSSPFRCTGEGRCYKQAREFYHAHHFRTRVRTELHTSASILDPKVRSRSTSARTTRSHRRSHTRRGIARRTRTPLRLCTPFPAARCAFRRRTSARGTYQQQALRIQQRVPLSFTFFFFFPFRAFLPFFLSSSSSFFSLFFFFPFSFGTLFFFSFFRVTLLFFFVFFSFVLLFFFFLFFAFSTSRPGPERNRTRTNDF